ncbi:MAG: hypothetical protein LDL07_06205 [Desulfarculus sp.]|nr:hypothetical protein [Desulfarculus sp.]
MSEQAKGESRLSKFTRGRLAPETVGEMLALLDRGDYKPAIAAALRQQHEMHNSLSGIQHNLRQLVTMEALRHPDPRIRAWAEDNLCFAFPLPEATDGNDA